MSARGGSRADMLRMIDFLRNQLNKQFDRIDVLLLASKFALEYIESQKIQTEEVRAICIEIRKAIRGN